MKRKNDNISAVMTVDSEMSFVRLKDKYKGRVNVCDTVKLFFFSAMAKSWKKLRTSNVVSPFIVWIYSVICRVIIHSCRISNNER